eukprot:CAMPEP_0184667496 /NCGR_PEP_ID=MMETSP0308-20130426/67756_1 /TAXON_ID=38269 /ORGANISM="Gloeochaete witrockiana, Strain SAG 46.84" /LENGTH=50 /DNA_ID=CAMNT_0027112741 /DNA_START=12 /DNA_END=161 /DNA_ORIENTATION=+
MLDVVLVRGRNLDIMDSMSRSSDPYCVLKMDEQQFKSAVVKRSLSPEWNA